MDKIGGFPISNYIPPLTFYSIYAKIIRLAFRSYVHFQTFPGITLERQDMSNITKVVLCFIAGLLVGNLILSPSHAPAPTAFAEKKVTRENLIDVLHQLDPDSYTYDPAELASWAVYIDRDGSAIPDEASISLDLRTEAVETHLINDPEYARYVYDRIAPQILAPMEP